MKNTFKKFLSVMLAIVLVLSMSPVSFAARTTTTVYVYAKGNAPSGSVANGHGWYTIGKIEVAGLPNPGDAPSGNQYSKYKSKVNKALNNIVRFEFNGSIDVDDIGEWNLHAVGNGADNYVGGGWTWHLDGQIQETDEEMYSVTYKANGGTGADVVDYGYKNEEVVQLWGNSGANAFTKAGYTFAGWSYTPNGSVITSSPKIDEENIILYAVWVPSSGTVYTVEYYLQNAMGTGYDLKESKTQRGTTGELTDASVLVYTGYTVTTPIENKIIAANGSTVIEIYYTRNAYALTINYVYEGGGEAAPQYKDTLKYGSSYLVNSPAISGFTPDKAEVKGAMGDGNVTVTVTYKANANTEYTVEHYWQNTNDDGYTLHESEIKTGVTGADTAAAPKSYEGMNALSFEQAKINGDGSSVVKIYYDRSEFIITYKVDGEVYGETETYRYGAAVNALRAQPSEAGKTFSGWSIIGGETVSEVLPATMPAYNITVEGSFTANSHTLTIHYIYADGTKAKEDYIRQFSYNDSYSIPSPAITGYTASVSAVTGRMPDADETVTVTYTAKTYTVTFKSGAGGSLDGGTEHVYTVPYGTQWSEITVPTPVPGANHSFDHWEPEFPETITENCEFTAIFVKRTALTITANSGTFTYDGTEHTVSGYTASNSGVKISGITAIASETDAGTYTVSFIGDIVIKKGNKDVTDQYAVTYKSGTLTIDPKAAIVSADGKQKEYLDNDPVFTGSVTGLVSEGDIVITGYERVAGEDVGNYVITPKYSANSNYSVTVRVGVLKIMPADVKIEVGDYTKTYGNNDPVYRVKMTGLKREGDIEILSFNRAVGEDVGRYELNASYADNPNYNIEYVAGSLTITARDVTITPDNSGKMYGTSDPVLTGTVTGLIAGDDIGVTYSREKGENVGKYVITASYGARANYNVLLNTGVFTISAVNMNVLSRGFNIKYDSTTHGIALSGVPAGSTVVFYSDAAHQNIIENMFKDVTGGPVTVYFEVTNPNYNSFSGSNTANITPRELVLTAPSTTWTYDGAEHFDHTAPAVTGDGLAGAETYTVAFSPESVITNVGTKDNVISGINFTTGKASNYSITLNGGVLKVEAADITGITSRGYDGIYDGDAHGITVSAPDGAAVTYYSDAALSAKIDNSFTNVVDTVVYYKVSLANHNSFSGSETVKISPRPITVKAADGVYTYDGTTHSSNKFYIVSSGTSFVKNEGIMSAVNDGSIKNVGTEVNKIVSLNFKANTDPNNYAVTYVDGLLKVNPAALTVTVHDASKTYGENDPEFTSDVAGLVAGEKINLVYTRDSGENVGRYNITAAADGANANYTVTSVTDGTLTIEPKAVTITTDGKTKVYSTADPEFTSSITGLLNDGDITVSGYKRDAGEDVGTYKIIPVYNANANYAVTVDSGLLTITPKGVTIAVNDTSKLYGDSDPAFTGTVTGVAAGDDLHVTYTRSAGENVGFYDITASYDKANGNYTVTVENVGEFEIKQRPVTITVDGKSKVYGDNDPEFTGTVEGLVDRADLGSITYTRESGEDVGKYAITPRFVANDNYAVTVKTAQLEITPKAVTIAVNSGSKVYGSADGNLSGTVTGLVHSGDIDVTYSREDGEDVGHYAVDAAYTQNNNYTVTVTKGDFEITPKTVIITVNSLSKYFGENDPVFTGSVTGLVSEGDIVITGYERVAGEDVGNYVITPKYTSNSNYSVTVRVGVLKILPADVKIEVGDYTKTYGNSDPVYRVKMTGLKRAGDIEILSFNRAVGEDVGRYEVNAAFSDNSNYNIEYAPGSLTITARDVTITPDNSGKMYGASDPVLTGTVTGLIAGDDLGVTYSRENGENVGKYAITASYGASANYNVLLNTGVFTISAVNMNVESRGFSVKYDSTAHGIALSGVPAGSTVVFYSDAAHRNEVENTFKDVTDGPVTVYFEVTNPNYNSFGGSNTANITPRELVLTAHSTTWTYDGAEHFDHTAPAVTGDGLAGAEAYTVAFSPESVITNVGTEGNVISGVTFTTGKASNYSITLNDGVLKVEAADIAGVTSSGYDGVYDGDAHGISVTAPDGATVTYYSDAALSVEIGNSFTSVADTVVYYKVSLANHNSFSGSETVKIAPRPITVKAADGVYTYDGTTHFSNKFYIVSSGTSFVKNEGIVSAVNEGSIKNFGTEVNKIVSLNFKANTDPGNYAVTYVDGLLTVNPAPLTVTVHDASKTYGENDPEFNSDIAGLVEGERINLVYTRDSGENVGRYNITAAADGANANYTVAGVTDGTLTIVPRAVTITTDGKTKVYSTADPEFTSSTTGLLNDGDITVSGYKRDAGEDVGTYKIIPVYNANANYEVTVDSGLLAITPKGVTIAVNDASKLYGDSDPAFTGTVTGVAAGDDLHVAYTRSAGENVGFYDITASYDKANGNYTVTVENVGEFEIKQRPVTITVDGKSKVYGDKNPEFTGTVEGLVDRADLGSITYTRESGEDVGKYAVDAAYTQNNNYTVTVTKGDFEITPKTVIITVNNLSKYFGENDPAFTGSISSLVGDDDLGVTFSRLPGEQVGRYAITAEYAASANYIVKVINGVLVIEPAEMPLIAATGYSGRYDGGNHGITVLGAPDGSTVTYYSDEALTTSVDNGFTNVSSNTVYYKVEKDNFNPATGSATVNITRRRVTLTAGSSARAYNGTALTNTAVTIGGEGFVSGEGASVYTEGVIANVGTAVNLVRYTLFAGTDAHNYEIVTSNGALTVRPAPVTINVGSATKTAGEDDPVFGGTVTGLIGGDTLAVTYSRAKGEDAGQYAITASYTPNGNYSVTVNNGTLDILEEIVDPVTPAAPGEGGGWALLNLILTVITGVMSAVMIVAYFFGKRKKEQDEYEERVKKNIWARLATLIPFAGAVIAFVLTENMRSKMVFTDKWTLLMAIIALVGVVTTVLAAKSNRTEKTEKQEESANK